MKRRTIKKHLHEKIENWLASIDNPRVQQLARENTIVTGGSIASMLLKEPVHDYDIYFRTKETVIAIAEYYVQRQDFPNLEGVEVREEVITNIKGEEEDRVIVWVASSGIAAEEEDEYAPELDNEIDNPYATEVCMGLSPEQIKSPYRLVYLSQNAITLSDKVQLILRFYGEPDKIHSNYDFVHAMCYYDHHTGKLVLPAEALEAMLSKTLYYRGSLYPICSIFRTRKFMSNGWRISAGELLKICYQISEIDLKDIKVLREQLIGVDALYFYQLVEALTCVQEIDEPDESFAERQAQRLSSCYVSTVIDKIFNDQD